MPMKGSQPLLFVFFLTQCLCRSECSSQTHTEVCLSVMDKLHSETERKQFKFSEKDPVHHMSMLTLNLRPYTVTCPRACSFLCLHSTRLRPLSIARVTFLLLTVGMTVPASRWGSVCKDTSIPLANTSRSEPSRPMK